MKTLYKFCLGLALCGAPSAYSQIDFENFDYSTGDLTSVSGGNWTAYDDSGLNPVQVTSPGLTYTGYEGSAIGNAATVSGGTGDYEDVERPFTSQCSGTIYTSFLINVDAGLDAQDKLVFTLRDNTDNNFAKVFVFREGTTFEFGISKTSTSPPARTNNNYNFGETYLLVLKYQYNNTLNNDDEVSLFIYEGNTIPSSEGQPNLSSNDNFDASCLDAVALVQDETTGSVTIDGIRVGLNFSDAPLPVELMNFNVSSVENKVFLNWATASEVNNAGFEVFRSEKSDIAVVNDFKKVGSYIINSELRGLGSSPTGKYYTFTDDDVSLREGATYIYKIVDVSTDGGRVEHEEKEVLLESETAIAAPGTPKMVTTWPNPATEIVSVGFSVQGESLLNAEVYNAAGIKVLSPVVSRIFAEGEHSVEFSVAGLPAGTYTLRIAGDSSFNVSKFTVIR